MKRNKTEKTKETPRGFALLTKTYLLEMTVIQRLMH